MPVAQAGKAVDEEPRNGYGTGLAVLRRTQHCSARLVIAPCAADTRPTPRKVEIPDLQRHRLADTRTGVREKPHKQTIIGIYP
ncbi:hypothetical protein Bpse01_06530 [Bifidobacterium pseudocatenulatum]|nr:hypothetical protein DN0207_12220 [Bifidobacterium pseudocatenulatum]GLZ82784.1 hypothetical protein Bpse01_06530 [Bifidobacterium pseudocatenulatum]